MHSHLMINSSNIADFIFGGKAYFTIVSKVSGTRYTYRVYKSKDSNVYFVSVMTGSDNNTSYSYIGMINRDMQFVLTAKSKYDFSDARVSAFTWFFSQIIHSGTKLGMMEFWHEGRCGCCGRRLTVPESIETGIGPECAKRIRRAA